MKLLSPRLTRGAALTTVASASLLWSACNPNQSVQSGAPQLIEVKISDGVTGSTLTIQPDTVACPAAAIPDASSDGADGGAAPADAGAAHGGAVAGSATATVEGTACDPATQPLCQFVAKSTWCSCVANPAAAMPTPSDADGGAGSGGMDDGGAVATPPANVWSCPSFSPASSVAFVFDRLLDTGPLDPGDAAGVTNVAHLTTTPASPVPLMTSATYMSNGSPKEVIFPVLGFVADGPTIFVAPQPALPAGPSGTAVTFALDGAKVRAKDGHTPFAASGVFGAGAITYSVSPFGATVAGPMVTDMKAGTVAPDASPATIAFNNVVDPTTVAAHVTVSVNDTPLPPDAFVVAPSTNLAFTVTPTATWPVSATIKIVVDAATADVVGDVLGSDVTGSFMTGAN